MNFMSRFFFIILICFVSLSHVKAQNVKGQVVDAETLLPIAFVNVVYSEGAGTVTDIDGKFEIRTNVAIQELRFSCLGYESQALAIDNFVGGKVLLHPLKYRLPTVNVLPSENPAVAIMKRVVDQKVKHDPSHYNPFSCIIYHKMTLDFDWPADLNAEERRELKDSLGLKDDSYLFLFESVSEKKHLKKGVEKEKVISGRVSGLKDPMLASFPAMLQPFSFYDQYIKLLGYAYLNPASKPGLSAYQFILEDTYVNLEGDSVYYISYRPGKGKNFRGLTGAFHIHGSSLAIQTVSATTTGTENGMRLFIKQKYQPLQNGLWFPKQLESSLEFGRIGVARQFPLPMIGKGKSYVTAINTQAQFNPKDFDNVVMEDVAISKSSPDVGVYRYEPLTAKDSLTYQLLDSIGRKNHLDALIKTQVSLIKGYVPIGVLQFDLSKLIDYNDYEGLKLGAGLYTGNQLSNKFTAGGYYTYGFGDKASKYGFNLSVTPFDEKYNRFYINYKDDVFATGSFEFLDGVKEMSSERFSRFLTETMDLSAGVTTGVNFKFLKYFKAGLYFKKHSIEPLKPYLFEGSDVLAPMFDLQETGVKLKWAHKETFNHTPLGMISNGTNWPTVWVNAAVGQQEFEEMFRYSSFETRLHKRFNYSNSMYTTLRVEGGILSGKYSNTMLYSALGSYKSFTILVPYTFGTMRLNEFGLERFGALYLSHGIPLSLNTDKRIKPEIVLGTNVVYGEAPDGISGLENGYYESGLYLKNLFSNFIFQYGLSVHYRYGAYQLPDAMDNWAFKLGLEFAF
ncbi:DUF5686 family protein [Carboxylicivirga sp. M1479]|uniref:DUF5686 family protein n=1 Tax=Carboxylicivirga sp. M1479 TaxID=2594476 RepID=UPI001177849A|nr:DUF5686 family protein [Carboxylicivirga sp. M1479]TRX71908.1 carboxypeptidase-like regulatory domain-containing protein [Carboxylicivirga sp. M1479]